MFFYSYYLSQSFNLIIWNSLWICSCKQVSDLLHLSSFFWMLSNSLTGIIALTKRPQISENEPMPIQIKCCYHVSGTVLMDYPPNWTRMHWMAMVKIMINMKMILLKKPLKTLYSPSFLLLIKLKICINMKVWNINV